MALRAIVTGLLMMAVLPVAAAPVSTPHVSAELVAEQTAILPGQPFTVALYKSIIPDWHTYWRNPGDSGIPTMLDWTLPDGFTAGEIQWPAPHALPFGPLVNYGYEGELLLLVEITPPDNIAAETVTFEAAAEWLVCKDICIPEFVDLTLDMPVAQTAEPSGWAGDFGRARSLLPRSVDWPARAEFTEESVTLAVTSADLPETGKVHFFPYEFGVLDYAAEQQASRDGDTLLISAARAEAVGIERVAGVLTVGGAAYEIFADASQAGVPVAPGAPLAGGNEAGPGGTAPGLPLWQAFLFAFLGGIILNLMPCVFPVLSMKAMHLLHHADAPKAQLRLDGLAYTAGVVLSFVALAGALLALRAGGEAIGWGFQLQSPVIVAILAFILFALGLNLSGVFELGTSLQGVGSGAVARGGVQGSFATGVLATVVAAPCTAPFMGSALGFAITQPAPIALAVFAALGLGLAAPFLLISLVPAAARALPRPGAWMERVKQLLAFPLYASAAWLIWVLAQQTDPNGVGAALLALVLIGFAAWLWGVAQRGSGRGRLAGGGVAALALIGAIALTSLMPTRPATAITAAEAKGHVAYDPARLAELRAANTPVFIDMTAAWCITCLANERVALEVPAVQERFAELGITFMKGDWTNRDPVITAKLEEYGRSGVPLYLLYPPGGGPADVLPQLLTPGIVLERLEQVVAAAS